MANITLSCVELENFVTSGGTVVLTQNMVDIEVKRYAHELANILGDGYQVAVGNDLQDKIDGMPFDYIDGPLFDCADATVRSEVEKAMTTLDRSFWK